MKRGIVFEAVGVAVALLIALGIATAESQCQSQQYAYRAETGKEDGRREVSDFAFDRPWLPCLVKRATAENQPREATEQEKRDLAAQEAAVGVAFWIGVTIAFIAFLQLIATIWGLIYIRGTLRATLKAVEDTSEATEAMREANELARREYERGFKPWLLVRAEGDKFLAERNTLTFKPEEGGRPRLLALGFKVVVQSLADIPATLVWKSLVIEDNEMRADVSMFDVITKGKEITLFDPAEDIILRLALTSETRERYMKEPPTVVGKFRYRDPLDNLWEIGFAFAPNVLWDDDFGRWGGADYNYERQIEKA